MRLSKLSVDAIFRVIQTHSGHLFEIAGFAIAISAIFAMIWLFLAILTGLVVDA